MKERIKIIKGDITKIKTDAIVNAANKTLLGGGGVDGAIHKAAGPELLEECKKLGGCKTGEAKITKGYNLPAKYVIHTVGPVWRDGKENEEDKLATCYRNSLELAVENKIKSVAFPSISTGAYGFPIEKAAPIALKEVKKFLEENDVIKEVIFVLFSEKDFQVYQNLVQKEFMKENKVETINKFQEKLRGLEDVPGAVLEKYSTVILAHGFGGDKRELGMFDDVAKSLTENNFLVYRFDFSGSGESEGDYSETSLTKLAGDLRSVIDFVKEQPKVDINKLAIVGMSFGTTISVVLNASEIKSYVLLGSVANPYEVLKKLFQEYTFNPKGESFRISSEGKHVKMGAQFWEDFSNYNPPKSISEIHKPICIIHGEKDTAAPLKEAKIFYENANEPKKLIIVKEADHGFYKLNERQEMVKELTDWFNKYLK